MATAEAAVLGMVWWGGSCIALVAEDMHMHMHMHAIHAARTDASARAPVGGGPGVADRTSPLGRCVPVSVFAVSKNCGFTTLSGGTLRGIRVEIMLYSRLGMRIWCYGAMKAGSRAPVT